jgi:hypothetical protein
LPLPILAKIISNASSYSAKKNLFGEPYGEMKTSILAAHFGHQPTNASPFLLRYILEYIRQHLKMIPICGRFFWFFLFNFLIQ